jgi:hypothetical protein
MDDSHSSFTSKSLETMRYYKSKGLCGMYGSSYQVFLNICEIFNLTPKTAPEAEQQCI